jgi:DNA polymerase III subunit alpha
MIDFAGHFHVHDEYSPLDGTGTRNQISYQAVRKGQSHLGFTNHGRLGGALEHVHACRHPEKLDNPIDGGPRSKDERLNPILGIEAFWRPDRFMECKSSVADHLCLHAASLNGWRTLMRLASKSWIKREYGGGFYGKPVIDLDMLEDDHEDLIVSTACIASPLSKMILLDDIEGARSWIYDMKDLVGDRLWLEIMPHDLEAQRTVNLALVNLGQETSTPLMVTGDVHMPYKKWVGTHEVVRMASYKQTFSKRDVKKDAGEDVYTERIDTVYMSSGMQLLAMFREHHPNLPEYVVKEALANTHEFARQVRPYVIGKTAKPPIVDVDAAAQVKQWMKEGWEEILEEYPASHWDRWSIDTYVDRMDYEYGVLEDKGVLDYFYITADFVRWAKSDLPLPVKMPDGELYYVPGERKKPIRVGLGRGSAAGCLISYLIGITSIDPIPHKLLFERFMNPDREGYPDIDIDFASDGRDLVKEYLRVVYGHDHVSDIIAYQTWAPRITIREIGSVYDIDYGRINRITDSIGETERGLEKIAADNELVAGLKRDHRKAWEDMTRLEGQILRDTRHAGGILITPKPTNWYVPTQTGSDEETIVTAWSDRIEFPILSNYGFLKWDVLGVTSLDKQQMCVDLIYDHYGEVVEPNDLPCLRDPYDVEGKVMDAFVAGLMGGVFQFSGRGITQFLRRYKPRTTVDLAVINAVYRPGPIKIMDEFIKRRRDPSKVTYWHDALEEVLSETLGLIAFQEQVMEICKVLGKFSGAQADYMRKSVSKLYRLGKEEAQAEMAQFYDQWMQGCRENHVKDDVANEIWGYILEWGGYGFNRSHSDSYGLQAYQDMHLKVHYPLAMYASILTIEHKAKKKEQQDFYKSILREARFFDIEAVGPDVNTSQLGWGIDGNKLRYGLLSVSGMGRGLVEQVVDYRPYEDYRDFVDRIPTGFGADKLVALAQAGAFDATDDREFLLSHTPQWAEGVAKLKVKMTCGHLKSRTVKAKSDDDDLEAMVEDAINDLTCPHHPDAKPADIKRLGDTYPVARWLKQYPNGSDPKIVSSPSMGELNDMELNVLNVSLTQSAFLLRFKPFLDKRIYTEGEVAALPKHPKRNGKMHGSWCTCERCKASRCVVGGEIINHKVIQTKAKDKMAFIDVAYEANQYSCTLFPKIYAQYEELLSKSALFLIAGYRDDRDSIVVTDIADVFEVAEEQEWEIA